MSETKYWAKNQSFEYCQGNLNHLLIHSPIRNSNKKFTFSQNDYGTSFLEVTSTHSKNNLKQNFHINNSKSKFDYTRFSNKCKYFSKFRLSSINPKIIHNQKSNQIHL